ncbi:MAG: undecaprenyldiphospho-muramoylpentapeptide beta-N-acetylglucosaminyltransferase [Armatimonadota bacterium]
MKIAMTGGGTAGHVTPNLALALRLQAQGIAIHYIGTQTGLEAQLVEQAGIPFSAIRAGKLRRYLDLRNIVDLFNTGIGFVQALAILNRVKPDLVFSKGGFVSCPVVWAAWLRHIPVILHESDITPGLANRLSMPFARNICVAFPETLQHIKNGKGVLTGIPIREALFTGSASAGRALCGFTDDRPVLLVIGGSQGSEMINTALRSALPALQEAFQVCHICGKGRIDAGLMEVPGYRQFEYVSEELPHLFAMTDVVVSRAGATILFELLALRKPHLLIPLSRRVSRGDQILNARSFAQRGFSNMLMEEDLSEISLQQQVLATYRDHDGYIEAMRRAESTPATEIIVDLISQYEM